MKNFPSKLERLIQLSVGSWRIAMERTLPEQRELVRRYDTAALLWDPLLWLLGYIKSYRDLFGKLGAHGWLEELREGSAVLDAGIGSAALSMALVKTRPCQLEIHGIDISPRMLAKAQAKIPELSRTGAILKLRYGNIDEMPYPDKHFNMVMSAHVLEHCHNPKATIMEMTRVLNGNGPLLIIATRPNPLSSMHRLRWRYRPMDPNSIKSWMYDAGLSDVRSYRLNNGLLLPGLMSSACIGRKK